ncbi:MAG TPA: hypothetical protein VKA67_00230 [Verrucomicrobiae bacterium]|nr:hypothetical protein [Verrucomicrobiae bacterium]
MIKPVRCILLLMMVPVFASAQIDPVKRELVQIGYNQALRGQPPFAGYAFYYLNKPDFIQTNLTLRLAIAPVYLDSELGIRQALGRNTDVGFGLAGGGFADSYDEFEQGRFIKQQSFIGSGAAASVSLYHCFNPAQTIPLNGVLRSTLHYATYAHDDTDPNFELPHDQWEGILRAGLRWGGREPTLFPALGMELSVWYEGLLRSNPGTYGYHDREINAQSHLFWAQALLAYTLPKSKQNFYVSLTAGTSIEADRFSAYRLGAMLPFSSEFPLSLPGYYFQELSARQYVLLGGNYLIPLDKGDRWNLSFNASTAWVDYLPGLEQSGHWNTGLGGGLLFQSSKKGLKLMIGYAYGVNAIRSGGRGANSIGILMQLDLEKTRAMLVNLNPLNSRGLQKIFGE